MVKRRVVAARHTGNSKKAPVAQAPVQGKPQRRQVEDDEIEDLEDEVEDEDEDEDVAPRRVSRRVVEEEIGDEDEDEDDEDEDDEEEVKPVSKRAAPQKAAPAPAPVSKPAPVAVIKPVKETLADSFLADLLGAMEVGKSLVMTRIADDKWQVTTGQSVVASKSLSNAAAWAEMANPEYLQWSNEWKDKTFEEKKKYAKKLGAKWEAHDNPKIEVIRITQAVRDVEGIEKYKPEYRTRSARAALRG